MLVQCDGVKCGLSARQRVTFVLQMPYFKVTPPKLDDCAIHGISSGNELLIVEGDSAAASVASVRSNHSQAVLAMQGKPLNALKASATKVGANDLYKRLSDALAVPLVDELSQPSLIAAQRLEQLRYGRIVLLFDPDADGVHCSALLMMFFYRWMRPLLESGRIEMVRFSVEEMKAWRPRGLGSIDPSYLEKTCVNPATRRSVPIGIADARAAIGVFSPSSRL